MECQSLALCPPVRAVLMSGPHVPSIPNTQAQKPRPPRASAANEARKELRAREEEGRIKGYPDEEFNKEILKEAEELQETVTLAEKAKSKMELEVERARSQVVSRRMSGGPGC